MIMHLSLNLSLFLLILSHLTLINCRTSSLDAFIYVGCSQIKYDADESNVNSLLASIVNSASYAIYNTFTVSLPASAPNHVVYGLFQCRGDLTSSDCHHCVSAAVTRLAAACAGASGGALQLEGCLVRYDNTSFVGAEDKTVVSDKCGPFDSSELTGVLSDLEAGGQYFRVSGSGRVQGVAQCVQDLSVGACQDCLSDAIQRLRTRCGSSAWGDMFLAKCYARYSQRRYTSKTENDDDEEEEKTLAIIIGLVAGVAILIVLLSFLSRALDHKGGGK